MTLWYSSKNVIFLAGPNQCLRDLQALLLNFDESGSGPIFAAYRTNAIGKYGAFTTLEPLKMVIPLVTAKNSLIIFLLN